MRLDELNPVPSSFSKLAAPIEADRAKKLYGIDPIYDQLEAELNKFGFEYLGAGYAGMVFSHPSKNYVLKVSIIDDTAYREFVGICRMNTNIHFPKIIGKPVTYKNNFLVTRIEKLRDVQNFNQIRNANSYLLHLLLTGDEVSHYLHNEYNWFLKDSDIDEDGAREFLSFYPQWQIAIQTCVRLARKYGELDLHKGNHMLRGRVPVIIDPVGVEHDWGD